MSAARTSRPAEVARFLGVDVASVGRYARAGRIPFSSTPSGHRRFNLVEVRLALSMPEPEPAPDASSAALLAFELEQIETDLARLNLRVQAFARSAQDLFRRRADG